MEQVGYRCMGRKRASINCSRTKSWQESGQETTFYTIALKVTGTKMQLSRKFSVHHWHTQLLNTVARFKSNETTQKYVNVNCCEHLKVPQCCRFSSFEKSWLIQHYVRFCIQWDNEKLHIISTGH